ncbi:L-ascorbate oxidase [Sarracenia purpurea var. burkii]
MLGLALLDEMGHQQRLPGLSSHPVLGLHEVRFKQRVRLEETVGEYSERLRRDEAGTKPSTVGSGAYFLNVNNTMDVILHNAKVLSANTNEIHQWYLHDHDFWGTRYREGRFSEQEEDRRLNLKNPSLRNTAMVFAVGWTGLSFVVDNPGAIEINIQDMPVGMPSSSCGDKSITLV